MAAGVLSPVTTAQQAPLGVLILKSSSRVVGAAARSCVEGCSHVGKISKQMGLEFKKKKKKKKASKLGGKKVKLSVFSDDMLLYIESPKDSTKKKPARTNQ